MGYWGWRPLVAVFVSVWVVGCSATHEEAPTVPPTIPPRVTLTVRIPITPLPLDVLPIPSPTTAPFTSPTPLIYVLQPGDTLLSVARQFGVPIAALQAANSGLAPHSLQIGQAIVIPNPQFNPAGSPIRPTATPLPLPVFPPACYEMPTNRVVCLGRVQNHLQQPVGRVSVRVTLIGKDGGWLAEGEAGIEQSVIPPGQSAPYRILFQADWRDYAGAMVALRSAELIGTTFVSPTVEDERGQWANGRYSLTALIRNSSPQAMRLHRALITLYNSAGQITGYRVVQLNHVLPAGETLPLSAEVPPLTADRDLTHTLYIEATVSN